MPFNLSGQWVPDENTAEYDLTMKYVNQTNPGPTEDDEEKVLKKLYTYDSATGIYRDDSDDPFEPEAEPEDNDMEIEE